MCVCGDRLDARIFQNAVKYWLWDCGFFLLWMFLAKNEWMISMMWMHKALCMPAWCWQRGDVVIMYYYLNWWSKPIFNVCVYVSDGWLIIEMTLTRHWVLRRQNRTDDDRKKSNRNGGKTSEWISEIRLAFINAKRRKAIVADLT